MPEVRAFCVKQEECLLEDTGKALKNFTIFSKLLTESLNDLANELSGKAVILLGSITLLAINFSSKHK